MNFQNAGVAAAQVIDRWSWWRQALKDPSKIGDTLLASENEPELGYYRTRFKGGQWEPVGIFLDDSGQMVAERGVERSRVDPSDVWTWCLRYPVTYEAHVKALRGEGYDDEPPAPVGHNSGEADPFERLRLDLADEQETATAFLEKPVETQDAADKLGIWSKRIAEIAKKAETERVTEKEPHLIAGRAVDEKWRPVIDGAKEFAARLKKHVEPFLIAQKRKAEEEARQAREEADRLRREAEERERAAARAEAARAAQSAADDGGVVEQMEAEAADLFRKAQEAEAAAARPKVSAGRTGARVSLRKEKRARIVDYDACLTALKDHPDMKALVQQLAQRAVKQNVPLAGVEVEEVEVAI